MSTLVQALCVWSAILISVNLVASQGIPPIGYAGGYGYPSYGGSGELEILVAKLIQAKLLALSSLASSQRYPYPPVGGYPGGGIGYPGGGIGYPGGGIGYPPVGGYPPYPIGGGYPPYYADNRQLPGPVGGYPGVYAGTGYRPGLTPFNSPIRR